MKISNGIALAVAVAMTPAAVAEIDLTYTGLGPTQWSDYSYDPAVLWDSGNRPADGAGFLGLIEFNGGDIAGYCYDIDAPVSDMAQSFNALTYADLSQDQQLRASILADLYDEWYFAAISTGDSSMATALAFLTNELMEENYDLIPGTFYVTDIRDQSSSMLGAIQAGGFDEATEAFIIAMTADLDFGTQAMLDGLVFYESVTGEWQDIVSYVPAPSAMALLGLAGLAGRRRREG